MEKTFIISRAAFFYTIYHDTYYLQYNLNKVIVLKKKYKREKFNIFLKGIIIIDKNKKTRLNLFE